jgi:predicted acyl esterase
VNPNRIGIDGVGLGSQIAWMALTQNMGYRDAVPGSFAGYAWDVMVPNNCVNNNINTFWLKPNVRLDPAIKQELWNDYLNLNTVQPLLDFFQSPDRNWSTSLNRLQGQVFAQGSWTDTYQFASAIIPTYANDPVSPKRMYLASNGEEDFDKFSDVSTQNETYRTQWHQRWLQDVQNGIDQGDPVTYLGYLPGDPANPANHTLVINTPAWPPAGVTSKTMYLDSHGSLAESAPHQHNSSDILTNTLLDPTYTITNAVYDESPAFALTWTKIPTSSVTYTSPPLAQDVWWLGAPSVSYYTSATGPNYNIVALYYDLDPATGARYLITRDQSCWHAGDPANRTVTGVPIARRLAAGHEIQVVFQNNDPETSRPRFIAQRIRPVFGNVTMTLYHESSRSTHTDLPLKPDQPSQPIFR